MRPAPDPRGKAPLLGVQLYLVAITLVVCANTVGKIALVDLPVWQVILAQIGGLFIAAFVAGRTLRIDRLIRTRRPGLQALRTFCQFGGAVCFYLGLRELGLAETIGIVLLIPLTITALAALFLGEPVGWRRWVACGFGLLGAFIIVKPGWPGANPAALWPLGTVVLFSIYTVLTRRLTTEDPAPNLMLWASLATVVVLGLGAPFYWVAPDWQGWLALAGVAGFSGVANASRIRALVLAPASLLAPFGYTQIATATLLGLVVFGEMPEPLTWLGIAIIVASGLYVWHRERVRGQPS